MSSDACSGKAGEIESTLYTAAMKQVEQPKGKTDQPVLTEALQDQVSKFSKDEWHQLVPQINDCSIARHGFQNLHIDLTPVEAPKN